MNQKTIELVGGALLGLLIGRTFFPSCECQTEKDLRSRRLTKTRLKKLNEKIKASESNPTLLGSEAKVSKDVTKVTGRLAKVGNTETKVSGEVVGDVPQESKVTAKAA